QHPHLRIILNRQPSLHRYNIMAFRPVPTKASDGLVVRINPLVCKGFGADFDGDEIAIHVPISDEENVEAQALEPTDARNLLSLADGSPLATFDQDFVMGHFLASTDVLHKKRLEVLFPTSRCKECKNLLARPEPWDGEHGKELMTHLCVAHPEAAAS